MMYRIRYLDDAVDDRDKIKSYLSKFYRGTTKRFFVKLKKSTSRLKQFPYSCRIYEDDPDYRVLAVGDYLVFYMVNEDVKCVDVHHIFHGSQDISKCL